MSTVLITGGSFGIGYAFAQLAAERFYRVIITGRDTEKLAASFRYMLTDVTYAVIRPGSLSRVLRLLS